MPAEKKSTLTTLEFIVTFVLLFFLTNAGLKYFFPKQFGGPEQQKAAVVELRMESKKVRSGGDPVVIIVNDTEKDLPLPKRCPQPPVDIAYIQADSAGAEVPEELMANQALLPCTDLLVVKAGTSERVNLASWKYALFERTGTYDVSLDLPEKFLPDATVTTVSARFSMVEPGFFTKIFRTFVSKPLLNGLLLIAAYSPGHNLGIAIILLTIIVKLLLLIPSQHALEGQKKLQEVQPRMEELKRKYPDDPKRVQEETMKLWKEMKINPLQSCLPTLLQLPILIGLFYVIRDGASVETSRHLVYSFFLSHPVTASHMFLGFDLLKPSVFVMPPLLVVLQFIQMKMMMKKAAKKKDEIVVQPGGKKKFELDQQTIMTYVLPFMIGFFAFKFPAAVSLYWGISTLFGIGQQWFVMRKK